jgi:hypothetical protein
MTVFSTFVTAFFIIAIIILPFSSSHFRKNKNLIQSYWIVILLYQVVAFTNAFWFRTLGADMDAHSFHVLAANISQVGEFQFASDASLYKNILGVLYWLTAPSHILGEQLSILSIAISIIVFVKILDLLKLNRYQVPLVFIYAAQPTMLMLGSITLREPFQVLFVILAFYFGLKMKIFLKNKITNFLFILLFSLMAGLLHKALFLYSMILIGVFLLWDIKNTNTIFRVTMPRIFVLVITTLILYVFFSVASNSSISGAEVFRMISSFEILDAIEKHRMDTPIGRASYNVGLDTSSLFSVIYSGFLIYINYLFSPFIWQVSNLADVYAYIESILHMILIYYSIKLWRLERGEMRQILGLLLLLFFIMSFIWSVGSTNYGTGMRHKMLSWWMLVLMGGPLFYENILFQIRLLKRGLHKK